jgi:hypothetical protein
VQDCPAQGLFDPGLVLAPSPNVTPAQIAAALAALNG